MKNLVHKLPFLYIKKVFIKNLKKTNFPNNANSVHRRRDLDSLGEFINF
jgi:hypothetical protein